jgi:hypothetical protein
MDKTKKTDSRFEFNQLPLVFSLQLAAPAGGERPLRLNATNISRSGLKFQSNSKIPLFEQVQIALFDKSSGKELATLFGKVVRVEEVDTGLGEKTYGIAVEFLTASPALDALLPAEADTPVVPEEEETEK